MMRKRAWGLIKKGKDKILQWLYPQTLFRSIIFLVVIAVFLFVVILIAVYALDKKLFNSTATDIGNIMTPSLTIVGGIGAVSYLVIAYRKQKNAESAIVSQRMVTAIEQLASDSPQKRIAGVYALAEISDTYRGEYKQRVVDILCGYLRTDRHGDRTEEFIARLESKLAGNSSAESNYDRLVSPDAAVESTIFQIMRERLLQNRTDSGKDLTDIQVKESDQLWCDCTFDLHGAVFVEKLDLSKVSFRNYIIFSEVYFVATADFTQALFCKTVDFDWASFDWARFNGARFNGARFNGARFNGARFNGARFNGASFDWARFNWARFNGARFNWARFVRTSFDWVSFVKARFVRTSFDEAKFEKQPLLYKIVFKDGKIPAELDEYLTERQKEYATNPANWFSEDES